MKQERIAYFDIAKFIGIMMIILGHFGVPDINRFVYTFHVPLFFLISGYFFKPADSMCLLIKTKFRQLIIPYILVMICVILIYIIKNFSESLTDILHGCALYFISYLYGSGYIEKIYNFQILSVGPVWFLPALLWGYIFLNYVLKTKYPFYTVILIFAAGYYSSAFIWLPFSIQSAMTAVLYMYLGYKAKVLKITNYNIRLTQTFPLLCLWGICLSYGGRFLLVQNYSVFLITDILASLAASYLVILYSRWLEKMSRFAGFMSYFGKCTIIILCLHSIDVTAMPWNSYFKTPSTGGLVVFIKILILCLKFLFPLLGAYGVSKNKFLKKLFSIRD